MLRNRYLSKRRGFTLIEAVGTTIILGIGLFVVGSAFFWEFGIINALRETTIATLAAQQEIEAIRGMPFSNILNLGSHFTFNKTTISSLRYLSNPQGDGYLDEVYGSGNNMRRLSVTVTWGSLSGRTMSKSLVTLVTNGGIDKQ